MHFVTPISYFFFACSLCMPFLYVASRCFSFILYETLFCFYLIFFVKWNKVFRADYNFLPSVKIYLKINTYGIKPIMHVRNMITLQKQNNNNKNFKILWLTIYTSQACSHTFRRLKNLQIWVDTWIIEIISTYSIARHFLNASQQALCIN